MLSRRSKTSEQSHNTEIQRANEKLKNRKAPGHDNITAEMVKACEKIIAPKLQELFNKIFTTHTIPAEINIGTIIPIPKPDRQKTVENLRPITFLPSTRKIFPILHLERIKSKIEKILPPSQSTYKANRLTADNVFVMKTLESQWNDFKRKNHVLLSKCLNHSTRSQEKSVL